MRSQMPYKIKPPDEEKYQMIIEDITVSEISSYDENYMNELRTLFEDPTRVSKRDWLAANGIKLHRRNINQRHSMSVRIVFYADLTEKQATEYHLRF
jgi:hypothetical protein